MKTKRNDLVRGLKAGIPIGLGYLSVSFSFGILAVSLGLTWWQALIISMTNLTSAGQLAGVQMMPYPGQGWMLFLSQLTINMRYAFMSVSLSQKVDGKLKGPWRFLLGFFMTDEIFAVANEEGATNKPVTRSYFAGLSVYPWIGWACGTLLGALLGSVLPHRIMDALCIAIYGMFIAIVVPEVKKSMAIAFVVAIAIVLSCLFQYLPALTTVPSGITITVCAIAAAAIGALLFPVADQKEEVDDHE